MSFRLPSTWGFWIHSLKQFFSKNRNQLHEQWCSKSHFYHLSSSHSILSIWDTNLAGLTYLFHRCLLSFSEEQEYSQLLDYLSKDINWRKTMLSYMKEWHHLHICSTWVSTWLCQQDILWMDLCHQFWSFSLFSWYLEWVHSLGKEFSLWDSDFLSSDRDLPFYTLKYEEIHCKCSADRRSLLFDLKTQYILSPIFDLWCWCFHRTNSKSSLPCKESQRHKIWLISSYPPLFASNFGNDSLQIEESWSVSPRIRI